MSKNNITITNPDEDDILEKEEGLDLWTNDRMMLLLGRPFLGILAMNLDLIPVVDYRCQTASTDGKRIFFNPKFIKGLDANERLTILAHEIWHCAMMHFTRQEGRMDKHRMWNYAIDHEVNALLKEDGFFIPDNCVIYEEHLGKSAEQVFELLSKGELPMCGQVMDDHLTDSMSDCNCDEEDGDGVEIELKVDPDFNPTRSDKVWKEWRAKVMAAAQQCTHRGRDIGAFQTKINELYPSKIGWKEALRQFLTPMFGGSRKWLPPNRRFVHQGLYLPSRRSENIMRIVVAIDTSGSTTGDIVCRFVSEVYGILNSFNNYELTLIQCDLEINHCEKYTTEKPFNPDEFTLHGGGGTDFYPPFLWVKEELNNDVEVMIYMTDGHGPAPENEPPYPMIWGVIEGGRMPADWGMVLELPL
ncbi:MAG: VWA-like domain-containing protein [Candidatus Poseidoniaceae archaeon]|jgi:predicted metal-dependent peptidase|nr:VWA-like domain-containing protein [Candidatus Poseidoniaceae archaeon]